MPEGSVATPSIKSLIQPSEVVPVPDYKEEPWVHPTGKKPHSVTILALGWSRASYIDKQITHNAGVHTDEIWTLNTGARAFQSHLCFVMDDLVSEEHKDKPYGMFLRNMKVPIITNTFYSGFDPCFQYPLKQVHDHFGKETWMIPNNSLPYIIAYAMFIGVQVLYICGADYVRANGSVIEDGKACVLYYIGLARAKGLTIAAPIDSNLLSCREYYGYLRQPDTSAW